MTARLVVIRHAKAGEAPRDIERPLTDRGLRDARAIGDWLRSIEVTPGRVVVSPARRARETWREAAGRLSGVPEPMIDDRIYENTVEDLLEIVHETPASVQTLALVGHNPSFAALAYELDDGEGDRDATRDLRAGFPTSATAVFEVTSWADAESTARLTAFAAPRG
jgi:phosphohistidine phosphatase